MIIEGIISALIIGITLGIFGGGGSILTVPVFVYLLGISPVLATAYSLFVVGASTMMGAAINFKKGNVSVKTALTFAVPSFIVVYLIRLYLIPNLPQHLFTIGGFEVSKDIGIMIFFALMMLAVAFSMLRTGKKIKELDPNKKPKHYYTLIAIDGVVVGALTGIVGAGGGFLIVPALVLLARLPIKLAIGTSLFIVSIKSMIGFLGDIQAGQVIDWDFLLSFTSITVGGIFIGTYASNFISAKSLKKGFGFFILVMAILVLYKELIIQ